MGFNVCTERVYKMLCTLRDVAHFPQPKRWSKYSGSYLCMQESDPRVYAPTLNELTVFLQKIGRESFSVSQCEVSIQRHHTGHHAMLSVHNRLQKDTVGYGEQPELACIDLIIAYARKQRVSGGGEVVPLIQKKTATPPPPKPIDSSNVRRMR